MKTNQLTEFPQLAQFTARLQQSLAPLNRLGQASSRFLSPNFKRSCRGLARRFNRSKTWLLGGLGSLLLLWFLWQWLVALMVGLAIMAGVYLAQQGQLKSWRGWQRLWSRANRALSLSALAGLIAAGTVYLSLAIWLESDRSWLASGLILEGLGLLTILSLLLWRQFSPSQSAAQPDYLAYLNQLAASDPLPRLIAIRQLTQIAQQSNPPLTAAHLSECFRLMLDREVEPLLCNALVESLQQLNPKPLPESQSVPLQVKAMQSRRKIHLDQRADG